MRLPSEGFILTTQWRDTRQGVVLDLWLATDNKPLCITVPAHPSVCFFRESDLGSIQELLTHFPAAYYQSVELKNTHGETVLALYCVNQRQLRDISDRCRAQNITVWEDNIKPPARFLMERYITAGVAIPDPTLIQEQQRFNTLSTQKLASADYLPSLKVLSLDIETSMDAKQLYSIAAYSEKISCVFMVDSTVKTTANSDSYQPLLIDGQVIEIIPCATEGDCLRRFIDWFQIVDPDVVIGWYVVQFDCWVLQTISDRLNIPLALGRAKSLPHWREDGRNAEGRRERRYLHLAGRVVLDGIELLRTAFYHFDSYSLNAVASKLLGDSKLIESNDRGAAITELFNHDKPQLAAYNLKDCQLVWAIFEKVELLDFAIERARLTGMAMDRMGGSVASFEYAYLPRLHRAGYVAPNLGELQSSVVSPGGHVMRSRPGLYRHVLVLDFKSLYPSIIRTFNIDPFAFWFAQHQQLSESEVIPGFNGAYFAREKSLLPAIIHELWQARDQAKRDHNKALSQAIKIMMNSFYGVLGSTGCRFFDPRVCSSITLRGHDILQQSGDWIQAKGYDVIYGDTDSVFVWLGDDCEDERAQQIGQQLAQELNQWWQAQLKEQFNIESALEIQFETHYTRFLMPTIRGSVEGSKKRYAGVVIETDTQGNKTERLVFKGLEAVRNDWTSLAKEFQQQLYQKVFAAAPYQVFIQDLVQTLQTGTLDEKLIYRKRLRRPLQQYLKSRPPHVKAARLWEQRSGDKMQSGDSIEYLITVNGPEPVSYRQSRIDYQHYIDKQLKPIADSILVFIGDHFERAMDIQRPLI